MYSNDITFCSNKICPKYQSCFRNFTEFAKQMSENELASVSTFENCPSENYRYFIKKEK